MRAQRCVALDGPEGLRLEEDLPTPDDEQGTRILVDVTAAGVSFPELLYCTGRYQERPALPFIPGVEVAGTVARAPEGGRFAVGDRVVAATFFGGWATQVAADPTMTFPLPPQLDDAQGAALVMNYQTAYFALRLRGRLASGETLLVQGAGGGLGTAAVQVGVGLGARVIGLVSSTDKADAALAAGAHEVVLVREGWARAVRARTAGRGVDVVFDVVGGDRFVDGLRCLAVDGRVIVVGFTGGPIPEVRVNRLLLTNTEIVGAAWGPYTRVDPSMPQAVHAALLPLITGGVVRPVVGPRFPLEGAPDALRVLQDRAAVGKVVLEL
ncbi:NADPH:quinone oxidoreductase family protein [Paraconexibacter algicola]|uniref:Alcohol dehydrogenase n=1 Tax=Paraconexibacter algicola TaxID=2133960 RepID=A0A2T4ULC0_9ACTN|nr:NADPH:quinone oxidoreductase family protein [Paraconexibacter algicola]PTL60034.1 alcohol dehydrogenase [Paraconexibacter algicola]